MSHEIELKLSLPQAWQPSFNELALLEQYRCEPISQHALINRYFDTPDQRLNHAAVALRIRQRGQDYIQTLKTRGDSRGGLHQRREWEWSVSQPQLDLSLLPLDALPEGVALDQLEVAFNTDFERRCWQLHYPYQDQVAEIELVLDSGWVILAERRDPISEVELELKSGPPEALFELALELAEQLPLRISRISKAERGYRLHNPERARPVPGWVGPTDRFDSNLAALQLERIQALLEAFEFCAEPQVLAALPATLQALEQQLTLAFVPDLAAALQHQRELLEQALTTSRAAELCQNWSQSRELGLCLLQISRWLFLSNE